MAQLREEKLSKRREAERRRIERARQDPVGLLRLQEKAKKSYAAKIKKGKIKLIDNCTPGEKCVKREEWRNASKKYRENCQLRKAVDLLEAKCQSNSFFS